MKFQNLFSYLILLGVCVPGLFAQTNPAELVVQTGHSGFIKSIAFSPDLKTMASGGDDRTVKLWDITTGKEIKTLEIYPDWVYSIAFSKDGKLLASGSRFVEDNLRLFDIETGNSRNLFGHTGSVFSVAFSPDGSKLATGSKDQTVRIWDTTTGREIRTFQDSSIGGKSHLLDVVAVSFSPDGKLVASGSRDRTIKIWNAETGALISVLGEDSFSNVSALAFSPAKDGARIVVGRNDGKVELWDLSAPKTPKLFEKNHDSQIMSLAYSPDGKKLVSTGADQSVFLWNAETGEVIKSFPKDKSEVHSAAFAPDGNTFAIGYRGRISLWNIRKDVEINSLTGHTNSVGSFAISRDGKRIAAGNWDHDVVIWNLELQLPPLLLSGHKKEINRVIFSPDNKLVASASDDQTIRLWDVESGTLKLVSPAFGEKIRAAVFSSDGQKIAFGTWEGSVAIWDFTSGDEIKRIGKHDQIVDTVALTKDGSKLASGSRDGEIRIWNLQSGVKLESFNHDSKEVHALAFSGSDEILVSGSLRRSSVGGDDGTIKFWNLASNQVSQTLPQKDPATFKKVFKEVPEFYRNHNSEPVTEDGKFRITLGDSGRINLSNAGSGKLLVSLVTLDKTEWAVASPNGLFDASAGARKLMHYAVGYETVSLEQMKDGFYVPGLLQNVAKSSPLPAVKLFTKDELFPDVEFEAPKDSKGDFEIKLKNRGGGIGQVQVLVNGKEIIADARPAGFDSDSPEATLTVDLEGAPILGGQDNKIEVVARNAKGTLNNRGTPRGVSVARIVGNVPPKPIPNVYAIFVGVSDYTGIKDLNYAAKDAEDMAKAIEIGASKLVGKENVRIRLLTSNGIDSKVKFDLPTENYKVMDARKEDIQKAFGDFKEATQNDLFIVYFAGHGVAAKTGSDVAGDKYFYLTREATTNGVDDADLRKSMTISSDELEEAMKKNNALKQVLILDTCFAGQAAASFITRRDSADAESKIRAIERLKDNTGFFVLMGSAADAVSYEAGQFGQGLLTYTLLRGMQGGRLKNDQFADVALLFDFAQETVPVLAQDIGGIQRPLIIVPVASQSFDIGQFTKTEQKQINLANPKPMFLSPRLLSRELLSDEDLNLTGLLRTELQNLASSRGKPSPIVFVPTESLKDAIVPSGLYSVSGETLVLDVVLRRNGQQIGGTITVSGKVLEKEKVIKQLVVQMLTAVE